MEEQLPQLAATLHVDPESHHLFTTLLQAGVEVKSPFDLEMGSFICSLPGFSEEYITSTVETIFLNGVPVDDLNQPFGGDKPTLALSAAMPGLAGAIFRKNSIHSALRTNTENAGEKSSSEKEIVVTLKLFNTIAKGAGASLIKNGVSMKSSKVVDFFARREGLSAFISNITLDGETTTYNHFLNRLSDAPTIDLKVKDAHG